MFLSYAVLEITVRTLIQDYAIRPTYSQTTGGDGLVAARHLVHYGYKPSVYYPKEGKNELYQVGGTYCFPITYVIKLTTTSASKPNSKTSMSPSFPTSQTL